MLGQSPQATAKIAVCVFFVGLVHDMAGSAALLLVAVVITSSVWEGLLYAVMFGLGFVGGMLGMSPVISVPLAATARRLPRMKAIVQVAAGLACLGLGLNLGYQVGIIDGPL